MILEPIGIEYMELITFDDVVQLAVDLEAFPLSIEITGDRLQKRLTVIHNAKELLELLENTNDGSALAYMDVEEYIIKKILESDESLWGMAYDENTGFWTIHSIDEETLEKNIKSYEQYVAKRDDKSTKMGALAVRTEEWKTN